ncbi:ABC transporter permease subunit [Serratia rubidaea]|uniref:ABC transporter permease subunit n=1 Tax=Serratia rubidaea TaxID=61652 RepID=UPI0023499E23|nr:ABC transporter permease subunit [Serratia rubidaea]MDC6109802.1 ABC transporter permease subunit [Serratia rubidaea]
MVQTTANQLPRDRRRARIDRGVQAMVTVSGLLVLMMLMLIFVYLLFAVLPLFKPASVDASPALRLNHASPALALGMDVQQRVGYRIDRQGEGQFYRLAARQGQAAGTLLASQRLLPAPTLLARAVGARDLFALAQADGRFIIAQADFAAAPQQKPHWSLPLGAQPQALLPHAGALTQLALTPAREAGAYLVAAVTERRQLLLARVAARQPAAVSAIALSEDVQQLVLAPDGRQLYLLSGNRLARYQIDGTQLRLQETQTLGEQAPYRLTALPGGSALIVHAADGTLQEWFDVEKNQRWRLTPAQQFTPQPAAGATVIAEPFRRVFAALQPDGAFALYSSIQSRPLLHARLAAGVQQAAFAPRGDGLLLETAQGWQQYRLNNDYPDVTWRSLWRKVWYENYPQPALVWQSTSGEDSYQAKFSLMPVIFGTLKAAGYAMLFAIPLALGGAVYTACFMSPALRRLVKPAIEVMGALPTVVIGLVAGIWLAPVIERHLLAILALPLLLAGAVLLCGIAQQRWRPGRLSPGGDLLLLLPALALTVWLAMALGPWLETLLFGQPMHFWLGDDFDQRNTLVVGVAMGFALVPVIFSLAEDALFSVPTTLTQGSLALGATPWQTVARVTLPAASAGIFSALMIGFGRAVGETMIVLMATGNTPIVDGSLFQGLRALAANIAIEMPEAVFASSHYRVLFLTALVLFVFTFIVNTLAEAIRQRLRERYSQNQEAP